MAQPAPRAGAEPVHPWLVRDLESCANNGPHGWFHILPLLEELLAARVAFGTAKYGRPLETENGRNALVDAWEEAVDLAFYLKQASMEGKPLNGALHSACSLVFDLTMACRHELERELIAHRPKPHPSEDALPPGAPVNSERRSVRCEGGN